MHSHEATGRKDQIQWISLISCVIPNNSSASIKAVCTWSSDLSWKILGSCKASLGLPSFALIHYAKDERERAAEKPNFLPQHIVL
jgi:hypothetical protein